MATKTNKTTTTKAAAAPTKAALTLQAVTPVCPQSALHNLVVKRNGKFSAAVHLALVNAINAGSKVKIKGTLAALYASFCAYNKISLPVSYTTSHTCMPTVWYGANSTPNLKTSLVTDAKKQAHYCCNVTAGFYTNTPTVTNLKALQALQLTSAATTPLLQAWATALKLTSFSAKAYWQHVTKLNS